MTDLSAPTRDIRGVLEALDAIVDDARRTESRAGYFAALYRTVTAKVQESIVTGFFDDPERMERLDVVFANRYLTAIDAHRRGRRPTRSWQAAFDAATQWRPLVLQHLLVGINAHINLDLGIATATTAPGAELPGLRRDFDRINEILASVVDQVRTDLAVVSPWIGLLDSVAGGVDDEVVRFSITVARTEAWRVATELAPVPPAQWTGPVRDRDRRVARLARTVLHPGFGMSGVLLAVRLRETNDVVRVIDVLSRVPAPSLATVEARVENTA